MTNERESAQDDSQHCKHASQNEWNLPGDPMGELCLFDVQVNTACGCLNKYRLRARSYWEAQRIAMLEIEKYLVIRKVKEGRKCVERDDANDQ